MCPLVTLVGGERAERDREQECLGQKRGNGFEGHQAGRCQDRQRGEQLAPWVSTKSWASSLADPHDVRETGG